MLGTSNTSTVSAWRRQGAAEWVALAWEWKLAARSAFRVCISVLMLPPEQDSCLLIVSYLVLTRAAISKESLSPLYCLHLSQI